MHVFIICV